MTFVSLPADGTVDPRRQLAALWAILARKGIQVPEASRAYDLPVDVAQVQCAQDARLVRVLAESDRVDWRFGLRSGRTPGDSLDGDPPATSPTGSPPSATSCTTLSSLKRRRTPTCTQAPDGRRPGRR